MRPSRHASPSLLRLLAALFLLFAGTAPLASAQATREVAVEVTAAVAAAPPSITLTWRPVSFTIALQKIYRRVKGAPEWGPAIATPANSATSYVDTAVEIGIAYEYFVYRVFDFDLGAAVGYVLAGIELPRVEKRGRVVLLVDATMAAPLAAELAQFQQDLIGDGWVVVREDIARTALPPQVRAVVQGRYNEDPAATRALVLFGRIPVPYAGNLVPDGHSDHVGAWPADVYYADVDGVWSDNAVDNTTAGRLQNHNQPGDGKWDQSSVFGLGRNGVELETGRIDFSDMPGAPATETELLRRYLQRDHAFRFKSGAYADVPRRGLIKDNFGYFNGEAFAATAWRNFPGLFGAESGAITEMNPALTDWFSELETNKYLWAYGCGGGSFLGAQGIGTSSDFYSRTSLAVFQALFGSYFGDWDSTDNFLRSPLAGAASSLGLASCWAGRPHWYFHSMALGETIGYGAKLSQNNRGQFTAGYAPNNQAALVHIALMGDPTLRLHPLLPPTNGTAAPAGNGVNLSWSASLETGIAGYAIARSSAADGPFVPMNNALVNGLTFTDRSAIPGASYTYRIEAVKLESQGALAAGQNNGSGTYFNSSQALFAAATAGLAAGQPEISVAGNGLPISAGETGTAVANGTAFGVAEIVPQTITRSFVISNAGDTALHLTGTPRVAISGPQAAEFTVAAQPPATLAPGANAFFQIVFDPAGLGPRSATVTIASDDADESPFQFAISGVGVVASPEIAVAPATIAAALSPGGTGSASFTITNSGEGALAETLTSSLAGYSFRTSDDFGGPTYDWIDLAPTGTAITSFSQADDALSAALPLGFSFPFYGQTFTTVRVCTNGFLSFTSSSTSAGNTPLPSTSAPGNLIAAFWDDLILAADSRIFTQQVAGNFVVQFQDMAFFGDTSGERVSFEIVLQPSGEIVFQYGDINATDDRATIGVQDRFRIDGLLVSYAQSVASGTAIRIMPPGVASWLGFSPMAGNVPAHDAASISLSLTASGLSGGQYFGEVKVASNDADEPLVPVAVQLTVNAPEVEVLGNGVTIANSATTTTAVDQTDFGNAVFSAAAVTKTFTIRNRGPQPLTLGAVVVSGAGFMLQSPPAASVPAFGATTFAVTFAPAVAGASSGSVAFTSNDADESVTTFTLAGLGITPIENWRLLHFGSAANAGAGADTADGDGDQSVNLLEYGLSGNPTAPGVAHRPVVSTSAGGYLQIQFTRDPAAFDLDYYVEASASLNGWTVIASSTGGAPVVASGAHSVLESSAGAVKTVTVEDAVPVARQPARFLRVRLKRP